MSDLVISCLSQKGGVGKSTLARLVAWTYASAGWKVKLADFNIKQLTSVDWAQQRAAAGHKPVISAEPYQSAKAFKRDAADLIVADGKPDSDNSSLEIAKASNLIIVPTGLAVDDLKPQVMFVNELVSLDIDPARILVVLNKITDSEVAVREARQYLSSVGYQVATTELSAMTGYQMAQNRGLAVTETTFPTLNEKADTLGAEIVEKVNQLQARNAA